MATIACLRRLRPGWIRPLLFLLPLPLIMALGIGHFWPGDGPDRTTATEPPVMTTDRPTYPDGEIVLIVGSKFDPSASLDVVVARPDGSIVTGDGSEAPGFDVVTADDEGAFAYGYQTTMTGAYVVSVYASPDSGHTIALATTVFSVELPPVAAYVGTDRQEYAPVDTANMFGSGLQPFASFDVVVGRPDGSIVTGDGTETAGWDSVTTDVDGTFTYVYEIVWVGDGNWTVDIYESADTGHANRLSGTTFTTQVTGPTITTDKADYQPGETATITGSGFDPGATYDIPITRPDGSIVTGDGSGTPGWDSVAADGFGGFVYQYQLDGIHGIYSADVFPSPWAGPQSADIPLATTTFTDPFCSPGSWPLFCCDYPWVLNEDGIRWDSDIRSDGASCRLGYIIDPGIGHFISRSFLLSNSGSFTSHSWTQNFLWYSDEKTITVRGERWSHCNWYNPVQIRPIGTACPNSKHVTPGDPVLGGTTQTLHVFEYSSEWINKVCGNYSAARTKPIPKLRGYVFWDKDGDGQKDSSEPWLSGWTLRIRRTASSVGQGTGILTPSPVTGGSGYTFNLDGHGPGTYRHELVLKTGWVATTPTQFSDSVGYGGGSKTYPTKYFGVRPQVDVSKTSGILGAPTRLEAGVDAVITVRNPLTHSGPSSETVVVQDTITPIVPPDCTVSFQQPPPTTLLHNQTVNVDVSFVVNCLDPSLHTFTFSDTVSTTTSGVVDPNMGNNTANSDPLSIPVFADADLAIAQTTNAPPFVDTGAPFEITVNKTVHNYGPYGPVDATIMPTVARPADCTVQPDPGNPGTVQELAISIATPIVERFYVTCTDPSDHAFTVDDCARVTTQHVEDPNPANDCAASDVTVGIGHAVISVCKNVVPPDGTSWEFTLTGPGTKPPIIVPDGQCRDFGNLNSGTYTVTETTDPRYVTSSQCDNGASDGDRVTFPLAPGEHVTCTFTNTKQPTLSVDKLCGQVPDSGLFNLRIDGVTQAVDAPCGGSTGPVIMPVGLHVVDETAGTGTDLTDYWTFIGGNCDADGNIVLGAGDVKTCTITNNRKATTGVIQIIKDALPDSDTDFSFSGTCFAAFTLDDDADPTLSNTYSAERGAGSCTVTEDPAPSLWDLVAIACVDPSGDTSADPAARTATINLAAQETVVCTFENAKMSVGGKAGLVTDGGAPASATASSGGEGAAFPGALGAALYAALAGVAFAAALGGGAWVRVRRRNR